MAGMGPPPKPDDQRRRRNAPTFDWVTLPADGRAGDPPPLPGYRAWSPLVVEWWAEIWASPQALEWQPSGVTLWPLAELLEQLARGETPTHTVVNSIMPLWRDHGLSPAGLQQRRWRVEKVSVVPDAGPGADRPALASVSRLRAPTGPLPQPPAVRAPKSEWVEHAVRCGMERPAAVELSKKDLVARFRRPAPKPDKAGKRRPSDRLKG